MLRCRDVAREASNFVDGPVTWQHRLALWLHLFYCVHCRRFMRHLKILRRFNGQRPQPPADPATVNRVMDRVSRESRE
ncbi:MAG: hypothetical protein HPY82_04050 [Gammaproteobacteria bacterium]|nr:hypothetical protein [Gammaproteobacteria bacterium]